MEKTDSLADGPPVISWWLLPPDYIRARHPALQRLEDNPIFLLWARRRMRKNYWKRLSKQVLLLCALSIFLLCLFPPFNRSLFPVSGALQKLVLFINVTLLITVILMLLVFQKSWKSREVSRYFAGCNETLIKDLLLTPIEIESIVYAGCAPLMCRAFILIMSILLPIITIIGVTVLSADINMSTAAFILILTLSIMLDLAYLYHADAAAIQTRLNYIHNLVFAPALNKVADEKQFKHLNKKWLFDFVKALAYFAPWAVVYLFLISTWFKNDVKTKLTLLIVFVILALIVGVFIGARRKSKSIERLAEYYRFIMDTYKGSGS